MHPTVTSSFLCIEWKVTLTSWFLCPSLPAGLLRFQTHTHMLRVSAGLDIGACKQSFCHLIPEEQVAFEKWEPQGEP